MPTTGSSTGDKKSLIGTIVCAITSLTLAACSAQAPPGAKDEAEQTAQDRAAAEANLQQLIAQKTASEERQRKLEAKRQAEAAARQAEAARPHYPPALLQSAAQPRVWGPVKIENMGIDAHFNSNWTDGHINYRVALLGQHVAIEQFMIQHPELHINFQDQPGNNIFDWIIEGRDFVWDPPSFNGGIPTLEVRGQVDCDLANYLNGVQWNLTWQQ